jgi:hypothetical protein
LRHVRGRKACGREGKEGGREGGREEGRAEKGVKAAAGRV